MMESPSPISRSVRLTPSKRALAPSKNCCADSSSACKEEDESVEIPKLSAANRSSARVVQKKQKEVHLPDVDNRDNLLFKRFDTVGDFSDHHYSGSATWTWQPPKEWAKTIQKEWKILDSDLPDTIFVRVSERRMDLLRAVIIGAQGTPYHDGLFFFDVFFPSSYPSEPPQVYYYSRGHRINPNLYDNGTVCLSLLNTWFGRRKEKWIPKESTILQVLVSIQGLVLNSKPFFNEPGTGMISGLPFMRTISQLYSENAFILSLKTMVCSIRNPPKNFEGLVTEHFSRRARHICLACKSYIDGGTSVGNVVKGGGVQMGALQRLGCFFRKQGCSENFKTQLAGYIATLLEAFKAVGFTDCDEFLSLAQKTTAGKIINTPKKRF